MGISKFGVGSFAIIGCLSATSCVAKIEDAIDKTQDSLKCESFKSSGTIDADLDVHVRAFLEATQQFRTLSAEVRTTVRTACVAIATDLGAENTWSGFAEDDDKSIRNNEGTGACDAAAAKINGIMEAHAEANFALVVTRGYCRQDFEEIQKCDRQCTQEQTCTPGTVETRCEAGQVSYVCNGKCKANAHCEGTINVAANCMGQCESTCEGECKGTCTHADGTRTENDANCQGQCSASCNGKCRGLCKVEASAGIDCGASVHCKGECEGTVSEPVCETTCSPPSCTVDTRCYDACTTQVQAKTVCEPSKVELYANVKASVEVEKLVATINANLSVLLDFAQVKGPVILDAANRLSASGNAVLEARGSMDVKSQACAVVAADESVAAASHLATSVKAGGTVTETCSGHSK
jgi:hypothetical protein